jgi:hypothetical protein
VTMAGGAQSLLRSRGELTPGLVLKASVAASVRDPADRSAMGIRVGLLVVPLPVAEADPERRLAAIAATTASRMFRVARAAAGQACLAVPCGLRACWELAPRVRQRVRGLLLY